MAAQSGVASLAYGDLKAAIARAETHLDGEALDLAFGNVASVLASTHPVAAADWVESSSGPPITDHVLVPLIRPLAGQAPARAWRLARQIQDPLAREKAVIEAMEVLIQNNPVAAKEELPDLPIDHLARSGAERTLSDTAALRTQLVTASGDP